MCFGTPRRMKMSSPTDEMGQLMIDPLGPFIRWKIVPPVRMACESVPRAVASVPLPRDWPWKPRSLPLAVLIQPHRSKLFSKELFM
jgi:hypothetical protein